MKKMVCELCGSNEFTKDDNGLFVCDYCRTKYTPEQAKNLFVEGVVKIDRSDEAEKLITLSKQALSTKNFDEAFNYSKLALEINPENSEAWLLRAKAVSNLIIGEDKELSFMGSIFYTFDELQIADMAGSYKAAVEFAVNDNKSKMAEEASNAIIVKASEIYEKSFEAVNIFPGHSVFYANHIKTCELLIELLNDAYEISKNQEILQKIVQICSTSLAGVEFKDADRLFFSKRIMHMPDDTSKKFEAYLQAANDEILMSEN
jgi:tetratricopeptide (TPR) repeat protein